MDDIVNVAKKYAAPAMIDSSLLIHMLNRSDEIIKQKHEALVKARKLVNEVYQEYWWRSRTNNWLKRHGYPMRRKRKRH